MKKVYAGLICGVILALVYFVGWLYPVSSGNRSGKLVKISNKGKVWKTCEGTLDLGSGDKLTWDFSVKDGRVCNELINNSGEFVNLNFKETFLGFPRDTHYQVIGFNLSGVTTNNSNLVDYRRGRSYENKDAFCSLLGSIYEDKDLYNKVKLMMERKNLYLYKKIESCNKP